ncbi:hypothetical protein DM02DRAFT_724953 [Periconia macrospinosa]|uniref:Uncharacterized protein n=1 Tax=Periconia macrospinosa TaxID=97972 RepID=A0A2V1E5Y2_9PLEO|nr:hypothetical protein DM02DRAFT_724953 [Periconia macrospinosa]
MTDPWSNIIAHAERDVHNTGVGSTSATPAIYCETNHTSGPFHILDPGSATHPSDSINKSFGHPSKTHWEAYGQHTIYPFGSINKSFGHPSRAHWEWDPFSTGSMTPTKRAQRNMPPGNSTQSYLVPIQSGNTWSLVNDGWVDASTSWVPVESDDEDLDYPRGYPTDKEIGWVTIAQVFGLLDPEAVGAPSSGVFHQPLSKDNKGNATMDNYLVISNPSEATTHLKSLGLSWKDVEHQIEGTFCIQSTYNDVRAFYMHAA